MIASISAGWPYRCTGMIPTVRRVIAASIAAGSIVKVLSSVSANTTLAPAWLIIAEVLIHERIVVNDRRYRRVDLAFDGLVLKLQIRKGYRHRSCFLFPPCQPASWVARIGSGNRNIPGHDRTRPDHDTVGNAYRHDGGVGADRNPIADQGLTPQLLAAARRPVGGERVVDEHHAMTDKTVIADRHQFADEGMRLHAGTGADAGAFLDLGKGSDEAIVSDLAAVDVARFHYPDPGAEFDIAHAGLMHLRLVHDTTPSRLSRVTKRNATSWPVSIDS